MWGEKNVTAEHTKYDKQTIIKLNIELLQQEDICPSEAVRAGMSAGDRHGARPDGSAYRSGVAPCRDGLPER